jgi:hypothetical protein
MTPPVTDQTRNRLPSDQPAPNGLELELTMSAEPESVVVTGVP